MIKFFSHFEVVYLLYNRTHGEKVAFFKNKRASFLAFCIGKNELFHKRSRLLRSIPNKKAVYILVMYNMSNSLCFLQIRN